MKKITTSKDPMKTTTKKSPYFLPKLNKLLKDLARLSEANGSYREAFGHHNEDISEDINATNDAIHAVVEAAQIEAVIHYINQNN